MVFRGMNVNTAWSYLCPMMTQIEDLKRETQDLRLMVSQLQRMISVLDIGRAQPQPASAAQSGQFQIAETLTRRTSVPEEVVLPTRRFQLPDDLLRIIFVNCLPNGREAAMKAHEAPVVLGRVCSRWRRVAWSTQELWDNLQISIPAVDRHTLEQQESRYNVYVDAIGSWLQRSGQRHLSISVVDDNLIEWHGGTEERMELIGRIMEKLLAETSRWKSVKLELPEESIWSHLPTHSSQLQVLESLEIRNSTLKLVRSGFEADRPTVYRTESLEIIKSPCLRSLHLGDVKIAGFEPSIQPQPGFFKSFWGSLRDLSIGEENPLGQGRSASITALDAHTILEHLGLAGVQLRTFRATLSSFEIDGDLDQIYLPSLRELTITDEGYGELSRFFQSLNCPSLISFKYQSHEIESYPFLHLLGVAQGLETLRLYIKSCPGLSECLKLCPQIKELYVSTELANELGDIGDVHLSSLESLVLDCTPAMGRTYIFQTYVGRRSDLEEATLRTGLERARHASLRQRIAVITKLCNDSRDNGGELRLKEVRFRLSNRLHDYALHRLAPFIAMGLRVTLMTDQYNIPPPVESPSCHRVEL